LDPNTQVYWDRVRAVNFSELSRLVKRDGWSMKKHYSQSDQLKTFYGNWCQIIRDYEDKHGSLLDAPVTIDINSKAFIIK